MVESLAGLGGRVNVKMRVNEKACRILYRIYIYIQGACL